MSLTLERQGGIAQPLKKRTVGQTNIAHVYNGANHIWSTSVIYFSDFTSVQLRYIWGGDNTDSGAECVMFNIESMIDLEDKIPDIMKMNLCANWLLLKLFVLIKINLSNAKWKRCLRLVSTILIERLVMLSMV